MKRKLILAFITATVILMQHQLFADKWVGTYAKDTTNIAPRVKAEGCPAAKAFTDLNINNVRCRINTGGDMWWDLQSNPKYEVPKGSGKMSMFSAALWIGGRDVNRQVRVSAQRYRGRGNDFWPGPLTTDGSASITSDQCVKYDKHFVIYRQDVEEFIAAWKDPASFPGYTAPSYFASYPAHGDVTLGQSRYLAPFKDVDGNGEYNPSGGDYPYYDVDKRFAKKEYIFEPTMENFDPLPNPPYENMGRMADQILKGDQTLWWVFNDKGNRQTESQGEAIGLEIRAQAFAFATNDAINDMTFYSYEIINRSTYRLDSTFFCQWVDPDIGYAFDDYVGCDVGRGLGYCYNGDPFDGTGKPEEYGAQAPAIGVDFFQGPYMDPNGSDDFWSLKDSTPGDPDHPAWNCINGVNFHYPNINNVTDSLIDNERFGMRRFLYHNNSSGPMGDPNNDAEYYNMLQGKWKGGQFMFYGGDAYNTGIQVPNLRCDFMFPGLTDRYNWGTRLTVPLNKNWTEEKVNNPPGDRRFMQSAGPFTLQPGAVNYITVGIPWARAESGGNWASVELLRVIDDKCQRLFDNNFRILNGPDAPDLVIQEFDKELVLYLTNKAFSNNYKDKYVEYDYNIVSPDSLQGADRYDSLYRFEGYMVFQVRDANVTANELYDVNKARLIAQCDRKNGISQIINYEYNVRLSSDVPVEKVYGADKGIVHSFRVFNDEFATGDKRLVNHKQYYFMAIAYAYNNYKNYTPGCSDCQKTPFLAGRKGARGQIVSVVGIPHITAVEANGTILNSVYGTGPNITRIEGHGNGGLVIDLTQESIDKIMASPTYNATTLEYEKNKGPLRIKVIDPLNVKSGNYTIKFNVRNGDADLDSSKWTLYDENMKVLATADTTINLLNEQLIMDLGISIQIEQVPVIANKHFPPPSDITKQNNKVNEGSFLESSIRFYGKDSIKWLTGLSDYDKDDVFNWIRSGTETGKDYSMGQDNNKYFFDENEQFENIINRTWAPYALTAGGDHYPGFGNYGTNYIQNDVKIADISSIDLFITSDKSKWSRSVVIEKCPFIDSTEFLFAAKKPKEHDLRQSYSRNKDGNIDTSEFKYGMSWFPGYAINTETGERLNIMFSEDSRFSGAVNPDYAKETGRDMIWNPTNTITKKGVQVWGGRQYVYIMGRDSARAQATPLTFVKPPAYDGCKWIWEKLYYTTDANTTHNGGQASVLRRRQVMATCMYAGIPLPATNTTWLGNDVHIRIRVSKPYRPGYSTMTVSSNPQNNNMPMYTFSTVGLEPTKGDNKTAVNALELINVVPNPYFAYSGYETDQVDTRVKITNLPEKCTVSIYTVNGTLVRQYTRDDKVITSLDWDLKNHAGIPISGGLYIIHIKADGIGEKVIKWFGALRPVDLNSF